MQNREFSAEEVQREHTGYHGDETSNLDDQLMGEDMSVEEIDSNLAPDTKHPPYGETTLL